MSVIQKQEESVERLTESSPTTNTQPPVAYTVFDVRQRRHLTFILGLTTITSPLTATIYLPLLPLLARRLDTSAQAINLTITIYIIFQALSPAIFATLSDSLGRRIIYLITLTLYVLSNLGLALAQNSYAALLTLRAVQSLGASAAYAISYGVVADVCVPAERGSMVGPISMALNLGTCVGPIVGGLVAYKSGNYGWIFWFLVVVGVVLLGAIAGFLPETARGVVGNGSLKTRRWWEQTWVTPLRTGAKALWNSIKHRKALGRCSKPNVERDAHESSPGENRFVAKKKLRISNPLQCLKILLFKESVPILLVHGFNYMIDYSIQTAIPSAFKEIYQFNELEIGLSYLPRGIGIIIGGYANGKFMDWNYRITAKQIGHVIDQEQGDDISKFPIEIARTRGSYYLLSLMTFVVVGYGWALNQHSHISIPLILQFIQGLLGASVYTSSNTLLVDILPEAPSTAAAAASIVRCALAALATATVQPLISEMDRGWYFTLLGTLTGSFSLIAVWTIRSWGMRWRASRTSRMSSLMLGEGQKENRGANSAIKLKTEEKV